MFSRAEIIVPTEALEANSATIRSAPAKLERKLPGALAPLRKEYVRTMSTEPPKWNGKREWESERQRRYVIAKLKREGNFPYVRTHTLSKGHNTELDVRRDGGILRGVNRVLYKRFVQGLQAQRMHIQSGWRQEAQVAPVYQRQAQVILRGVWRDVSTPVGARR